MLLTISALAILFAILLAWSFSSKHRELHFGELVFHKEDIIGGDLVISEKIELPTVYDAMKAYSRSVKRLAINAKNVEEDLYQWSRHEIETERSKIVLCRYGRFVESRRVLNSSQRK